MIGKKSIFHHTQKTGKKFDQNNKTIVHNILFVSYSEEITVAYKSKHSFRWKNQVILLMINDGVEKCYYSAVKKFVRIMFFRMVKKIKKQQ